MSMFGFAPDIGVGAAQAVYVSCICFRHSDRLWWRRRMVEGKELLPGLSFGLVLQPGPPALGLGVVADVRDLGAAN